MSQKRLATEGRHRLHRAERKAKNQAIQRELKLPQVAQQKLASGRGAEPNGIWNYRGSAAARDASQGSSRGRKHPGFSPPPVFQLSLTAFCWLNLPEGKLGNTVACNLEQSREGARMDRSESKQENYQYRARKSPGSAQAPPPKPDKAVFSL